MGAFPDKIDKRMIESLRTDGRMPLARLAKKCRISLPRAHYRLNRLREERVILDFYPIVDWSKLGLTAFRLMVQFLSPDSGARQSFVERLKNDPHVLWTAECGGRWDLLVDFLEENIYALDRRITGLRGLFPGLDLSYDFLTILQIFEFSQGGIGKGHAPTYPTELLSGKKAQTDEKDWRILQALVKNGRFSVREISHETQIHPATIQKRLDRMKKEKILLGVLPQLNAEKFGLEKFKILLSIRADSQSKIKMIRHLALRTETRGILELLGPWSLEIEFDCAGAHEAKEFFFGLRKQFGNEIRDFELLSIPREYNYRYAPLAD